MIEQPFYEAEESADSLIAAPPRGTGRLVFFYLVVIVVFAVFAGRIVYLQRVKGEELQTLADDNRHRTILTNAPRGIIYDRNRVPLVRNVPSYNVTIIPAYVPDDDEQAAEMYDRLSAILEVPVTTTITLELSLIHI